MGITYYSVFKNSNGDVGIGTTSPTAQSGYRFLQVNGSTSAIIEATVGGTRIGGFDSTASALYVGSIGSYPVIFRTAVDEKMRISANGNVGIGTSSPSTRLHVYSDANQPILIQGTTAGTWMDFQSSTSNLLSIGADGTRGIGFYNRTTAADLMTISSAGNVGIGTTSPSQLLEVAGSSPIIRVLATSGNATLRLTDNGVRNWDLKVVDTSDYFEVGGTNTTSLIVTGTGNVGIGTTSPSNTKLHVVADWVSGHSTVKVQGITDNTTGYGFYDTAGSRLGYLAYTGAGFEWYNNANVPMIFYTNTSEKMRIASGGNVGIGTTSPTQKLEVAGFVMGGTTYRTSIGASGSGAYIYFGDTSNLYSIGRMGGYNSLFNISSFNGPISFQISDSEKVRIDSNGNVGIGTTSPSNKLHILGNVIVGNGTYNVGTGYFLRFPFDSGNLTSGTIRGHIQFDSVEDYSVNANDTWKWKIAAVARPGNAGNYNSSLEFMRSTRTGVTDQTVFSLNGYGGYVGIGTNNPSTTLHVYGVSFTFEDTSTSSDIQIGPMVNNYPYIRFDSYISDNSGYFWGFGQKTSAGVTRVNAFFLDNNRGLYSADQLSVVTWTANEYNSSYPTFTEPVKLRASGVSYFNGGNVGIGTTSPAFALDVTGGVGLNTSGTGVSVTIGANNTSDRYLRIRNSNGNFEIGSAGNQHYLYGIGASNYFSIYTNVTERMRITADGVVLIGTTSAYNSSRLLQVKDGLLIGNSLYTFASIDTNSSADLILSSNANPANLGANSNIIFKLGTSGGGGPTERMRIVSDGNVGIGTTSVLTKLVVSNGSGENFEFGPGESSLNGGYIEYINRNSSSTRPDFNFYLGSGGGSYKFYTNGSNERMRITSAGNVGIATSSPNSSLQVAGSATIGPYNTLYAGTGVNSLNINATSYPVLALYYGTTLAGTFTGYSDHVAINTPASKYISFEPNDSEIMRLTSAGNVGIGTTSPAYKLEVASGTSGQQSLVNFRTADSTTANNAGIQIFATPSATATSREAVMALDADGANASGGDYFLIKKRGNSGTTDFEQYSNASMRFGTNFISRATYDMTIANDGNVGIGTTSPNTKLEVYGVVRITESASGGILQMQAGSSALDFASTYYGGTYRPFTFTNGGSERMRIQSDGNVGIGTTSPLRKFHVAGGTSDATIRADTTNADANLTLTTLGQQDWGIGVDYSDSGKLKFDTSTTVGDNTKMTILSDGNVGIGTTNPSQKLEIVGGEIKAGRVNSGEEGGQVSFGRASDNATGWYIDVYGSTSTPQLRFVDVSNSSVRMVVNQSGNLGIGTASPTTKLEVIGDIAAFANGADTITRGVYIANAANTRAFNFQLNSGGTNLDLWSYNSAGAWVRRVSFNYDGNVGIGTTAPSSTLYVSGNVGISGNITKGGGSFLIEHPDPAKQGWKLQHSFVESPTVGDNIYRYEITINETLQGAIELPNYWKHLNENPQIWINPVNHFGIAYGEINEDISRLTVFANSVGKYNILLIGTRKDPTIKKIMADFAVERKPE